MLPPEPHGSLTMPFYEYDDSEEFYNSLPPEIREQARLRDHTVKMAALWLWFSEKSSEICAMAKEHPIEGYEYKEIHKASRQLLIVIDRNDDLPFRHPDKWDTVEGLIVAATGIEDVDDVGRPLVAPDQRHLPTQLQLANNMVFHLIMREVLETEIALTSAGIPQFPSNLSCGGKAYLN